MTMIVTGEEGTGQIGYKDRIVGARTETEQQPNNVASARAGSSDVRTAGAKRWGEGPIKARNSKAYYRGKKPSETRLRPSFFRIGADPSSFFNKDKICRIHQRR